MTLDEVKFSVEGMTCASCVAHVQKAAMAVKGVENVRVNLATGVAAVTLDSSRASAQAIVTAIANAGYPAMAEDAAADHDHHHHDHAELWRNRAIVGLILWFPLE